MNATVQFTIYLTLTPGKRTNAQAYEFMRKAINDAMLTLAIDRPSIQGIVVSPGLDMTNSGVIVETKPV